MRGRARRLWAGLALAALIAMLACSTPASILPTAEPTPTITPVPATALPTLPPTPTLPPDWGTAAPGIEVRVLPIAAEGKSSEALAFLLRIDPALADIRIVYDKEAPATVEDWAAKLGAVAVINAGYFQEDYTSAGLIADGVGRYGVSFGGSEDYAEGMFSMLGGALAIRSLAAQPYDPAEPLDLAVQGLPMLVDAGAPVTFDLPDRVARRTAIALDAQGRLIIVHVSSGVITLTRLRDWLVSQPDLGIVSALNLDGGTSTGLVVVGGPWTVENDSVNRVPSVIAVTPR